MSRVDMMKKSGITEDDFKPKPNDDKQRLDDIENALIELAEMLTEVSDNG